MYRCEIQNDLTMYCTVRTSMRRQDNDD